MTVAQRTSAARMIAAKGQAVTLTRRTSGAYSNGASAIAETTQASHAVILPHSPRGGLRDMAGANIPEGLLDCILAGVTTGGAALTAPHVDDRLTDTNGIAYAIKTVSPLKPAGLAIIYELTLAAHDG